MREEFDRTIDLVPTDRSVHVMAGATSDTAPAPKLSVFEKLGCALLRRRIRRAIGSELEIHLEEQLELELADERDNRGLRFGVLIAAFATAETRKRAEVVLGNLAGLGSRVVRIAASNVRERVDLQTHRIEYASGHLHELRAALDPLPDWSELDIPPPPDSIEDDFEAEELARHELVLERRHLLEVALKCVLAVAAVGLEFEVLLLTVDGVWGGTSPSSSTLTLSMTTALAGLMLGLARLARSAPGWPIRTAAGFTLLTLAGCLSLFRSGLLMSPEAAVEGSLNLELLAINAVIFICSVGMCILGEIAIEWAHEAFKARQTFRDENAPGLARARSRLRSIVAHDWFRTAKRELAQKMRIGFERALPDEIRRTEDRLILEHAETRRILRDELGMVRLKLDGPIDAVAELLARWWYEERSR